MSGQALDSGQERDEMTGIFGGVLVGVMWFDPAHHDTSS